MEPVSIVALAKTITNGIDVVKGVEAVRRSASEVRPFPAIESIALGHGPGAIGNAGFVPTDVLVESLGVDMGQLGDVVLRRGESTGVAPSEALRRAGDDSTGDVGPAVKTTDVKDVFDAQSWKVAKSAEGELVRPEQIAERFRPLRVEENLTAYVGHIRE